MPAIIREICQEVLNSMAIIFETCLSSMMGCLQALKKPTALSLLGF
jgi:hypothetical protein